jgi:hypothetical protein
MELCHEIAKSMDAAHRLTKSFYLPGPNITDRILTELLAGKAEILSEYGGSARSKEMVQRLTNLVNARRGQAR